MARISGVNLDDNMKIGYALTRIKGIGWSLARALLQPLKINTSKRIKDLTAEELASITAKVDEVPTEGELIRKVRADIQRLQVTGSYRGIRHTRGLPARGQRTRSNARTKRGKRKTVGAFKKEELAKVQPNAGGEKGETK
ncbi:MAG: 30S ribosomal protein S13 [Candidatus Woesebacteria bacterium GW2011_GWC1_43_10b]|uniref:Small ribosomal subunit protein uS13 n=2 Tax=Candidatus Woeseibacteriota TaxID=1752722 RepID=A0A0G1GIC1_9BACT|nr:MAG: 30S ribosomal protein S13 [Candidatus Woesebacteria bacterium GW2011_GWC1_43_10b]KKT34290.1 MAG: 30S ribosomal protein S13 [Candidatus Woesebacteria bacterium GW2011_GWB1_44_11b]